MRRASSELRCGAGSCISPVLVLRAGVVEDGRQAGGESDGGKQRSEAAKAQVGRWSLLSPRWQLRHPKTRQIIANLPVYPALMLNACVHAGKRRIQSRRPPSRSRPLLYRNPTRPFLRHLPAQPLLRPPQTTAVSRHPLLSSPASAELNRRGGQMAGSREGRDYSSQTCARPRKGFVSARNG
jgi:hypothetical protein